MRGDRGPAALVCFAVAAAGASDIRQALRERSRALTRGRRPGIGGTCRAVVHGKLRQPHVQGLREHCQTVLVRSVGAVRVTRAAGEVRAVHLSSINRAVVRPVRWCRIEAGGHRCSVRDTQGSSELTHSGTVVDELRNGALDSTDPTLSVLQGSSVLRVSLGLMRAQTITHTLRC
jgi:hypothetical protein